MDEGRVGKLRRMARLALLAGVLALSLGTAVEAQDAGGSLLPPGFFDRLPQIGPEQAGITADRLTYDADTHEVVAEGHVELGYRGYQLSGDHLVFDQRAHTAHFAGRVVVRGVDGTVYTGSDISLSEPMRRALMRQLTITTPSGGLVTAADGDFQGGGDSTVTDATYAPCGQCIDAKGRRIGWSVKASRMIYHGKSMIVTIEQPSLYLLGVRVAALPWLSLPDPTRRSSRFLTPSVDYSPQLGAVLNVPYMFAVDEGTDLIFTPSLLSRQGVMLGGEWDKRFPAGAIKVKANGIYQLDPSAFAGNVGDRSWRGAFQTSGHFVAFNDWQFGWSYTAFSDAAYLTDYHYRVFDDKNLVNEAYATHLSRDEFIDFRVQQFNLLGNVTDAQQQQQGRTLPNLRYSNVLHLPGDEGEIDLMASLLGVQRSADVTPVSLNSVPYQFGYAGYKAHGMAEADWQRRWIVPGGLVATPFLGVRTDLAYYDGSSMLKPGQIELFNATPIAALDLRFPLVARDGTATHVIEPIAQLVYRASDVTDVGITNDNAQSFVFEDTNLFSYNRFSGTDRQETGLRANIGGHYQVNFANGSWLDLLGGQSFQLAGANAFAAADPTEATTGQGLSASASYLAFGAKGSPLTGLNFGSKLQIDPTAPRVTRAGLGGTYALGPYDFALDYLYVAQDVPRGVLANQHEVAAGVGLPLADYWRGTAHVGWDLANNTWLDAGAGVRYDDGYLEYGGDITATGPTNIDANDLRVTASFSLKGLGGALPERVVPALW